MTLRPIDAIFIDPERRLYVIYLRGELWQLPRMEISHAAWQRRQPYTNNTNGLYLSHNQSITDSILAQKLRTLNLPNAVRGSNFSKFEAWWEVHGFKWINQLINNGQSPLAAHQPSPQTSSIDSNQIILDQNRVADEVSLAEVASDEAGESIDIFADMLADLTNEVRYHRS